MTQPQVSVTEDALDLEENSKSGKPAPERKTYRIRIDKEHFVVPGSSIIGYQILELVGKKPSLYRLYQHFRGADSKVVDPKATVDLRAPGVERFTTMKLENTDG